MIMRYVALGLLTQACLALPAMAEARLPSASDPKSTVAAGQVGAGNVAIVTLPKSNGNRSSQLGPHNPQVGSPQAGTAPWLAPTSK